MLRIAASTALAAALFAAVPAAAQTTYYFGHHAKYVNITFESHTDVETILGSTHEASGSVTADSAKVDGSVTVTVPVASLRTGVDLRDEHLRSPMWLDAAKYPDLSFTSKSVKKAEGKENVVQVTGDFSLHGVKKEMTIPVEWKPVPAEAAKKNRFPEGQWMRFTAEFKVKLSDFGVRIPEIGADEVQDEWTVKMVLFGGTGKPGEKK